MKQGTTEDSDSTFLLQVDEVDVLDLAHVFQPKKNKNKDLPHVWE